MQNILRSCITSVALEVIENKGLTNEAMTDSVASFYKCFVFNDLDFPPEDSCSEKSVRFPGSTHPFDLPDGTANGLGALLQGGLSWAARGACGRSGRCGSGNGVSGSGQPWSHAVGSGQVSKSGSCPVKAGPGGGQDSVSNS